MFYRNQAVIDGLPKVKSTGYQFAQLVEEGDINNKTKRTPEQNKQFLYEGVPVYSFLMNPETIQWSLPIEYKETQIPYTNINQVNFVAGGNITMTLPDLILDTHYEGKSIELLLNRLRDLRTPTVKNGLVSYPKRLYFRWGSYRFGVCVLTGIQTTITKVIDGKPSKARLSITLKEVPAIAQNSPVNDAKKVIAKPTGKIPGVTIDTPTNTLKKALTAKQIEDAKAATNRYLAVKKTLFNKKTQDILNDPKSNIVINKDTGSVDLVNSVNGSVINLGNYNGNIFIPAI
jgi:hypothetical protein